MWLQGVPTELGLLLRHPRSLQETDFPGHSLWEQNRELGKPLCCAPFPCLPLFPIRTWGHPGSTGPCIGEHWIDYWGRSLRYSWGTLPV